MTEKKNERPSANMEELRKRAEEQARRENEKSDAMPPAELAETLHELRTHQIELEMQNEQLRQSQEELLATQDRLTDLYDFAPVGYLTLSNKGLIVEANMTCAKMLGVDRGHLLHQPFSAFVVVEDQDIYFRHRRLVINTEKQQTCELRLCGTAREPFWASLESVLKTSAGEDAQSCLRISIADVSTRHLAQEKAETLGREWETTFNAIHDSVALLDEGGRIRRCNEATARLLARPIDQIVGHCCWELIHDADKPIETCPYVRMKKSLRRESAEIHQDGKSLRVTVDPLLNGAGGVTGAVHTIVDITNHKRHAAEMRDMERRVHHAEKLESLGVLAGGIAHDFNNILTTVLGNLELVLGSTPQDSQTRPLLEEAENGAKRAAGLTAQMLAYSGRGHFVVTPLDINLVMREIIHFLNSSISKKAEMKTCLAPDLPEVRGDASQIQQIAMNLIVNASEAIGEGQSGSITITTGAQECNSEYLEQSRLEEKATGGKYVVIEVTDTGCGMDETALTKLFDPFYTTKFTGRGLGLSAVLGIVRGHNGAITVESKIGKGTTFKVFLPALVQQVEKPEAAPIQTCRGNWQGAGTVLVVDDEESLLRLGDLFLRNMGFDTLQARDGQAAVEMFRSNADRIVCVLLDLTMPRMDGVEAFLELRKISEDLPVILCSGFDQDELIERYTGYGIAGFIQKPYTQTTLRETLRGILDSKP